MRDVAMHDSFVFSTEGFVNINYADVRTALCCSKIACHKVSALMYRETADILMTD